MQEFAVIVTITVIVSLAAFGAVFIAFGSVDADVIRNCQEQGWHNFGQTRIICSVEPKKEAK